ncbi:E3 ubiquitin-protein ligase MBR2-like isoform X2 [Cynara cardunculus var. scolymus]|uniref:E3 ubiquitin-protein ligase MBR2-like isoform X2 n=1 Tax=Cynara cardunculus var. scolymus TaxID=59895 RepID=UPI000D62EBA5|nr:E3 ubiquitin-protein ligase MBR2-like isoform X2 [Cynara cardunculus var. scolymus]
MDVYYSKQAVAGIAAPRKRSVTALKDTAGSRDGTSQFCNRIGCCGRLNHTKGTKNKCLEKPKPFKSSFRASSGKEVTSGSSKNSSSVKKSLLESEKKLSSKVETIPTELSSVSDESEIQELNASGSHKERKLKSRNTTAIKTTEVPSLSTRIRKVSAPQITDFGIVEKSQNGKNGLKSLRCNTISDGYRQKDPNSESNNGGKRSTVKKRFTQGESSSSGKGKRVSGISANEGHSRNWTACKPNGGSSVRTRRSMNVDPPTGSMKRLHGDNLSLVQSNNVIPDIQTQIVWPSIENSVTETSLSTNDASSTMVSVTSTDHHPVVRFVNHNGTRHYNIDGVADVLLALDRIEQDEELTYEQLLSREANLFLGGLNFYDQHRDMRLDIDNMSYEELLVLEEKMGTVSTALSEDELSKCIRISIYESLQLEDGRMRCSWGADDSKCSICQEEFVRGDEIGRVGCGHGYHTPCINQWLRLKNWCPICKASPSSSP